MSYIFNNFEGTRSFSDVVAEAKAAGYTEPDPRDDLSGTDVARKVRSLVLSDKLILLGVWRDSNSGSSTMIPY